MRLARAAARRCARILRSRGTVALGCAALLVVTTQAPAQQIVPDGRTATRLDINGNVTDVSTATLSGGNAFNSFSRFNVDAGNVVNLHVPASAAHLINIVRDRRTDIHGILNSIQDGRIGGSVYFANPHGLLVGPQGVINVGSLTVSTPTQNFVDGFFLAPGSPNEQAVQQLLAGTAPRSGTGLITIEGEINAIDDIRLRAGTIDVGGSLYAGARFLGAAPDFGDVVNANGVESATNVVLREGRILLLADDDVTLAGTVAAPGGAGVNGGEVTIRAGGDVVLNAGAHVSARGNGTGSSGGTVDIWADNDAAFNQGAVIDARGGTTGDGGFIELSAGRTVRVAGGRFRAGAEQGNAGRILIDPEDIELIGVDQFTDGADLSLIANNSITVGENVTISTRNLLTGANDDDVSAEDHATAASAGDSGDLTLEASHIVLESGARLLAHGDNGYAGGDVKVEAVHVNALGADRTAEASITAENATITGHDVTLSARAETSGIVQVLEQTPDITLEEAQKFLDNEADDLSDGPGGEFLALKTRATAKTRLFGVTIEGAGAVSIGAEAGARAGFEKNATAEVVIGDLVDDEGNVLARSDIRGDTVAIASEADTSLTFNVLGNTLRLVDQSWLPAEDSGEIQLLNDQLFDYSPVPLVSLSQATAQTTISGGTFIGATDSVAVSSTGVSAAKPTFSSPLLFSAAWGESTVTAQTSVGGTTEIDAGGSAAVTAVTDAEVNVTADVNSINKPIDAVFVRAKNTATTTAEVGGDTVTTAGSVEVAASTTADISAAALAKNAGGSGVGIAVAVNESTTTTSASLGGDVTAHLGDVAVRATTDIAKNNTSAEAATLGNPSSLSAKIANFQAGIQRNVAGSILTATGKIDQAKADRITGFLFPGIKEGKFNASGAVAYVDSDNSASASIASGATVKAEGDIDVTSTITDRPNASVGARSTSTGTAIGGAAVVAGQVPCLAHEACDTRGGFSNTANAYIGKNATVDAKGALTVDAQTAVPYPWEIDWNSPAAILNHLQAGILDLALTSYGINSASGKDGAGLAAAVNVFGMENESNAWIDEGAKINTVYAGDASALPQQSVTVHAKNEVNTVNAVGILSKKFLGTSGGKAAVGGSANIIDVTGTATATIRGDAEVNSANGVTVDAESLNRLVTVAEAGGSSDKVGIEGALSMNTISNTTVAAIDDDATVDAGGDVDVDAASEIRTISVAGGVVATKGPVGIGMSVSLNDLDSDTRAFIGDYDPLDQDTAPATGDVAAGGRLTVKATSNTEIGAYSVAGALATSSSAQTDVPADAQETQDGAGSAGGASNAGKGKFGIAVSGDASVNTIAADTLAYIADGATVSRADSAEIAAATELAINALSGAVTISTQQEGNSLSGSYAHNTLGGATAAYAADAELTVSGDLDVGAEVTGEIKTLSASLAGTRGKAGVAGAVSINEITNRTEAYLARSSIHDVQSLVLSALDGSAIRSVAGAAAFGGKAGVGLSFAWNKLENDTLAYVQDSDADARGDVSLSAETDNAIDTVSAAVGASKGQMAGAGSVSINTVRNETQAYVAGKKTAAGLDAAGDVALDAIDGSRIFAVAGSVGASSGQAGVGVAFAWSDVGNEVNAAVRNGADVASDGGDVRVQADSTTEIEAIAVGGGVANKVGVAGSASVVQASNTVSAGIAGSRVRADGNALVTADDDVRIFSLAGNVAAGGKAAIGVSNSTLITDNTVEAGIDGNADVAAAGNQAADEVYDGRKDGDGKRTTESRTGVAVSATSHEQIQTIAAGGSGAGSAGVAGSATVTVLNETTTASIGAGARVNESNAASAAGQDVLVRASDETGMLGVAGAVAFGGSGGVGAGADVGVITKTTRAAIDSSATTPTAVNAKDTVMVEARGVEDIQSISASLAAGGSAGVAGAVSAYDLTTATTAAIGAAAQVASDGNVVVAADQATELDLIAGNAALGGSAGVGASAGVAIVDQTTNATIGAGAEVTALGNAAAVNAADGRFDVSFVADADEEGEVSAPATNPQADHASSDSQALGQQRQATAHTTPVKGVAVTATSRNDVESISATGAIGGSGAATLAGNVNVITTRTTAEIADDAQVNRDNAGAGAEQSVLVAAGNDHYHMGVAGSASGGGSVGIGVGADVLVASHTTRARIGESADVRARRDVAVSAAAQQEILSLSAGLGVSGTVGVAGSGAAIALDNTTEALTGSGSSIDAGGNVRIAASDDTDTDQVVGTVAIGLGAAGVGGSVGVTTISKDTTAAVGEGATVNARGNATGTMSAYSGDDLDDTDDIKGLAVEARSSEDVLAVAAAGAGGFYAGVAGAVTVETIDSDTTAAIGADAEINKGVNDADAAQDVNVSARNSVRLRTGTGALGIGIAGVAGGVDVASVRNDTGASIGDGAEVYAARDVDVNALSKTDLDAAVVSAGGGIVGVAGAVAVYSVGSGLDPESRERLATPEDDEFADVNSYADDQAADDSVGTLLAGSSDTRIRSIGAEAQGRRSAISTAGGLSGATPSGNAAVIGSATVRAGRDIDVDARRQVDVDVITGALAVGGVGLGAGVGVVEVNGANRAVIAGGARASAGGDVAVSAASGGVGNVDAYVGSGGVVAIDAGVAIYDENTTTAAEIGDGAELTGADAIDIAAIDRRTVGAHAFGASVGAAAAGASVAQATIGGTVRASIGADVQIGQGADTVNDVRVTADSESRAESDAEAAKAGLGLATGGAAATATADAAVTAGIGAGADLKVQNAVAVEATGKLSADATALGVNVSLGGSVGASVALAKASPRIGASLGAGVTIEANSLTIEAAQAVLGDGTKARATGASGGLMVGVNATVASAENDGEVEAAVGDNSTLTVAGATRVRADNRSRQHSSAEGLSLGFLAAGANVAETTSDTRTHATLGDDVHVSGGTLAVEATGSDVNTANAVAGSGGVVSGAAASAATHGTSDTLARTGRGSDTRRIAVDALDVRAAHTTQFNGAVDSVNASLVGASGAIAAHDVNSTVFAGIGAGGRVSAHDVDIEAENRSHKFWLGASTATQDAAMNPDDAAWNVRSGSGGLIDLPAGSSKTHITHATTAAVGADARVHVLMPAVGNGLFNMDALNEIIAHDKAKLDSGGAIAVAKAVSHAVVDEATASVEFGEDAEVVSDLGDINAGARSLIDLATRASADAYGAAGAPSGEAYSVYNGLNRAVVHDGVLIRADDGHVRLAGGQTSGGAPSRIRAEADVNLWNKTAFPIETKPDAQANIRNDAAVQLLGSSRVESAGDIWLSADKGSVSADAKGIGKDIYRETAGEVASGVSKLFGGGDVSFDIHGGSTSVGGLAAVTVNGTALAGIHRNESLVLDYELIDENGNVVSTPVVDPDTGLVRWRLKATKTDGVEFSVDPAVGLAANIQERIERLRSLMAQYAGDPAAVAAYQAEIDFLEFKLLELGYAGEDENGNIAMGTWNNPSPRDEALEQIEEFEAQASGAGTEINSAAGTVHTTATDALTVVTTIESNADTVVTTHTTASGNNATIQTHLQSLGGFDANDAGYQSLLDLQAQNAALASDIAALRSANATDRSQAALRRDAIDSLLATIDDRTHEIEGLIESNAPQEQIDALRVEIDGLQASLADEVAQLDTLLSNISDRTADIDTKTDQLVSNNTAIGSWQNALAGAFSDGSEGDIATLAAISTLHDANADLYGAISAAAGAIDTDAALISGYATAVASGSSTIGTALTEKTSAQDRIADLTAQLPTLSDVPADGPTADFVHVDDIRVRLGNIRVTADDLTGSGVLSAPGDAQISITNNTPDFLVVNDLSILSDEGGTIRLNGVLVNDNADINRVNASGTGAAFSTVRTRDSQGPDVPKPAITITSNYDPLGAGTRIPAPAPNIELAGDIENLRGSVTVHSKAGSILVNGNIRAGTVDVKAENGDFVQSFVDGFRHVGGDPASIQDHGTELGSGIVANGSVFISARYLNINSLVQSGIEQWNIVLPEDPILTGSAAFYGVNPTDIENARTAYQNAVATGNASQIEAARRVTLTTTQGLEVVYDAEKDRIEATTDFAVADSATSDWESRTATNSGLYQLVSDYGNIGANYDPLNDRYVLDGEVVKGGYIQLFGQILNTSEGSAGKLRVLDGYGQIHVENPTDRAVVLNRLDAGADPTGTGRGTAGRIDIMDIQEINPDNSSDVIHTVYTRDYDVESGVGVMSILTERGVLGTDGLFDIDFSSSSTSTANNGRTASYNPQTGLRYVWTTGTDNSSVKYWKFSGSQFFGISELRTKPEGKVEYEKGPYILSSYRLDNGTYLIKDTGQTGTHFTSSSTTYQTDESVWHKTGSGSKCNWWTVCIAQDYWSKWTETIPTKTITTKTLKADYPIAIEFMGWDQGTVSVESSADVILNGDIRNNAGATTIRSTAGSIFQGNDTALISSRDLTLDAAGSVGGALGSDPVRSIQTALGGVLDAEAASGNVLVTQTAGDLRVGTVTAGGAPTAGAGKVVLQSDGSIVAASGASLIEGGRIELTSDSGAIGATDAPLAVNVGYVDNLNDRRFYGLAAQAAGDIGIEARAWSGNAEGDLLLDTVVSHGGDVRLAAPGRILDNNPLETIDTRTWDELLAFWDSLGLREGEASNAAKQAQAVESFENGVTRNYRLYWLMRGRQTDGGAEYDPGFAYTVTATERDALAAQGYDAADIAAFEASRTAQYHELHAEVGALNGGEFDPAFVYVASDAERETILKGSSWTERELGISITPGLLKDVTSTNPVVKAPNVEGRNVTLEAGVAVGETLAGIDIPTDIDPAALTDEQKVALAAAERSDLTITDDLITVNRRKPVNFEALDSLNLLLHPAVSAHPDNGLAFLASLGDARLGTIQAPGETRIKVRGSIVNAGADSLVRTGDLVLEAANGGIGWIPDDGVNPARPQPLHLDLLSGATLTARAASDVDIVEDAGDMNVDTVFSRRDVRLSAAGSIVDAHAAPENELNVLADSIALHAANGSIGDGDNALDVGVGLDGRITATAPRVGEGGGVYLHGPLGAGFRIGDVTSGDAIELSSDVDMLLDGLVQGPGAIGLTAGGEVRMTPEAHVHATTLGLLVNAGSLFMEDDGTDAARMTIDVGTTSIHTAGDAVLTGIFTSNPTESALEIIAGGSILDGGDVYEDIVADAGALSTLTMVAGGTIGNDPLDLQLRNLNAVSSGLTHLDLRGSVHVQRLLAGGELRLNAGVGGSGWITGELIQAPSMHLFAPDGIDVESLQVGSRLGLVSERVTGGVRHTGSGLLRASLGGIGGPASFVDLDMTSPVGIAFDHLAVVDGALRVPRTDLWAGGVFVDNAFTVDNEATFLVIDHTDVRPRFDADIQLYAREQPFDFVLRGTVLETDASITRRRKRTHTVLPLTPGRGIDVGEQMDRELETASLPPFRLPQAPVLEGASGTVSYDQAPVATKECTQDASSPACE